MAKIGKSIETEPKLRDRFLWWLSGKESACQGGLIPGLGKSPGEGNGNPCQYSCLENPMDRGATAGQSMGLQRVEDTETEKLLIARIQRGKRINWDYEIDCGTDKKVLGLDNGYNCITL